MEVGQGACAESWAYERWVTDDLIATGPDDIEAAIATVRRLVGSPDEHNFQLRVSSRPGVNRTVMVGLGALARVLIRIHTETGDDEVPADRHAVKGTANDDPTSPAVGPAERQAVRAA